MTIKHNVIGQRFGRLVVIANLQGKLRLCQCDCGGMAERVLSHLKRTKIPGCNQCASERNALGAKKHGDWDGEKPSKLYNIWYSMRSRCRNPKVYGYQYYGGKGITVCQRWQDFSNFRNWALSNEYIEGLSIERIDSAKDYEPSNCEWITRSENTRRSNVTRKIDYYNNANKIIERCKLHIKNVLYKAA